MTCQNPFHYGMRADIHSGTDACLNKYTRSGDIYCLNACHTHPERIASELDDEGCYRLFDAIVNSSIPPRLKPLSEIERREIATFYLDLMGEELEELCAARRARLMGEAS